MRLPFRFWRLGAASAASNLADGFFTVALPLLALQLTRSPLAIAGVTVASRLPWLGFALIAGVVADRVDRRRLMVGVELARATCIGLAAVDVAAGTATVWHLYALALALGVAETLFDSAAQSIVPRLVSTDRLAAANSRLYGIEVVANTFLGPPLGGMIAAIGIELALGGSSGAYLLAALLLLGLPGHFRAERPPAPPSIRVELREGLRYLWRHMLLRRLALLVGGVSLAFSAVLAVLPLWAVWPGPMGLTPSTFGVFLGATGVGALLASLSAECVARRLGAARALRVAIAVMAVFAASPLLIHPIAVGLIFLAGGFSVVVWNVITVSLRQRIVPDHLLGRVNAAYRLLAWGSGPIGAAIGGLLAQAVTLRMTFVAAAVATLALLLPARRLTNQQLE